MFIVTQIPFYLKEKNNYYLPVFFFKFIIDIEDSRLHVFMHLWKI